MLFKRSSNGDLRGVAQNESGNLNPQKRSVNSMSFETSELRTLIRYPLVSVTGIKVSPEGLNYTRHRSCERTGMDKSGPPVIWCVRLGPYVSIETVSGDRCQIKQAGNNHIG